MYADSEKRACGVILASVQPPSAAAATTIRTRARMAGTLRPGHGKARKWSIVGVRAAVGTKWRWGAVRGWGAACGVRRAWGARWRWSTSPRPYVRSGEHLANRLKAIRSVRVRH